MSAHALTIDVIRARVRADVDRERVRDAAPDLLAALEEMLNQYGHYCEHTEDPAEVEAQENARAAIAKAGGAT